jgi:hypothetical protein
MPAIGTRSGGHPKWALRGSWKDEERQERDRTGRRLSRSERYEETQSRRKGENTTPIRPIEAHFVSSATYCRYVLGVMSTNVHALL